MHSLTQPSGCLFSTFSLPEQFRYKRRVYAQNLIDDKQFAKLHTKVRRQPQGGGSRTLLLLSPMAGIPLPQPLLGFVMSKMSFKNEGWV